MKPLETDSSGPSVDIESQSLVGENGKHTNGVTKDESEMETVPMMGGDKDDFTTPKPEARDKSVASFAPTTNGYGLLLNQNENLVEDLQTMMNQGKLGEAIKADLKLMFGAKSGWKVWLSMFFPCIEWLVTYNWKKNIVTDIIAGLSVGAMIVPQSIAYAGIARLPANIGLFSAMTPIYMYVIFGGCRELAPGPTALNAIMVGSVLPALFSDLPSNPNLPDTPELAIAQQHYNDLAQQVALACGILYLIIGFLRLGFLVNFLSSSVTSGFTTAAGLFIISAQFKYMSGIKVSKPCSTMIEYIIEYSKHIHDFNWRSFLMGSCLCAALTVMKKVGTKWHKLMMLKALGPLIIAVTGIIVSAAVGLEKHHIMKTVKHIPAGLPKPTFYLWGAIAHPQEEVPDLTSMFGVAWPITFIGLIEGVSTARTIATRLKYDVNINKEIIAFGVINMTNAGFNGYPGSGSMVRSAVAFGTGCKSQIYSVVVATIVMIAILAMRPLFQFMPLCALAAIVISGCFSLLEFDEMIFLWKASKVDFATWQVAFWFTVCLGLKDGVVISVILSLVIVLSRSAFPKVNRLGRLAVEGSDEYRPTGDTRDELEVTPEVLIVDVEQALYFANSNHVKDKMYMMAKRANAEAALGGSRLKYVVLNMAASPYCDSTVMHMMEDAVVYFAELQQRLIICELTDTARVLLKRGKVYDKIGERFIFGTVHMANQYCIDMVKSGKDEEFAAIHHNDH